jgi:hypothetical protein
MIIVFEAGILGYYQNECITETKKPGKPEKKQDHCI